MSSYGFVKAGAYSPKAVVADPDANARNAYIALLEASSEDIQLAVFPELFLSGYTCADLLTDGVLLDGCKKALEWLLKKSEMLEIAFAVGLPVKAGNMLFDCAAVCFRGEVVGIVPKTCITNRSDCFGTRYFSSGDDYKGDSINFLSKEVPFGNILFNIGNFAPFGVEIGDDIYAAVSPSDLSALSGAEIILNLSAENEIVSLNEIRKNLLKSKSGKNICSYVYASAGCGESSTDGVYAGACYIAENGKIIAGSSRFSQKGSFAKACIDYQKLSFLRLKSDIFKSSAAKYAEKPMTVLLEISELSEKGIDRAFDRNPFVPKGKNTAQERFEEIYTIQSTALAKRLSHLNMKKIILGVSGGLDSTLALLVSIKTAEILSLKKSDIICVSMPGFGTTDTTKTNSRDLIEAVGAQYREVDIKPACLRHFKDISHDENIHDVTYENTQARERTQILMDIANKEGALLVGTGDLSEIALGWSTYNGDHMSMYNVNCSIPKTLIPHLLNFIASTSETNISLIIREIIDTPVSPELLPPDENGNMVQKTEDTLGAYELHDFFLYHFIRTGASPEKLMFMAQKAFEGKYEKDVIAKTLKTFITRFFNNQFKRSCSADGPVVGSVGLSPRSSWKMPSDAVHTGWSIFFE